MTHKRVSHISGARSGQLTRPYDEETPNIITNAQIEELIG